MASTIGLTVSFPSPGFFLVDATGRIFLDGSVVYQGSFKEGFTAIAQVAPGSHELKTEIQLGPIRRKQTYRLDLEPSDRSCDVQLVYSRFWGNFAARPTITIVH